MPDIFSIVEDAEIIRLKERAPFTGWRDLAAAFVAAFPNTTRGTWGTLQVRYSRYLQAGKKHRARALALLGSAPAGKFCFLCNFQVLRYQG